MTTFGAIQWACVALTGGNAAMLGARGLKLCGHGVVSEYFHNCQNGDSEVKILIAQSFQFLFKDKIYAGFSLIMCLKVGTYTVCTYKHSRQVDTFNIQKFFNYCHINLAI